MYSVEKFNDNYLFVYQHCLSNKQWVLNYGFDFFTFNIQKFIKDSVLSNYKNVVKIIIKKCNNPIGFSHICFDDKNGCVVVGGILPELINSGIGIYVAIIVYKYTFGQFSDIETIKINVLKSNRSSIKMNSKIGFNKINEYISENGLTETMVLYRIDFPNIFTNSILSKMKYEIK